MVSQGQSCVQEKSGYASTNSLLKYGRNIRGGISHSTAHSSPYTPQQGSTKPSPVLSRLSMGIIWEIFISFTIKLVGIMYVFPLAVKLSFILQHCIRQSIGIYSYLSISLFISLSIRLSIAQLAFIVPIYLYRSYLYLSILMLALSNLIYAYLYLSFYIYLSLYLQSYLYLFFIQSYLYLFLSNHFKSYLFFDTCCFI